MLESREDRHHLRRAQREHKGFFMRAFWGEFSDARPFVPPENRLDVPVRAAQRNCEHG